MAPSSSAAAYVLGGNIGRVSVVLIFVVDLIHFIVSLFTQETYSDGCSYEKVIGLDEHCMKEHWTHIFSTLPYYEFFVIFNVCFRILSCIVFYIMEDVFNKYETAKNNRDLLLFGTILGACERAFTTGLIGATAWGAILSEESPNFHPLVGLTFSRSIANAASNWIFIIRYLILSIGIFTYSIFDRKDGYVGKQFSLIGYILTFCGFLQLVSGVLELCNMHFFRIVTGILDMIFNILFLVWIFIFSTVCRQKTDHLTESLNPDKSDISN